MKNSTKALIAGGIGAALLLGGAGTIAYWTDTEDGGRGTITAGTLELGGDDITNGGWLISHQGDGTGEATDPVVFDPAEGDQIVPGDVLSYTETIPVTLAGENIAAEFTSDITVEATDAATTADDELATAIRQQGLVATELTGASEDWTLASNEGTAVLTGAGEGTVDVTTTITFPWGDADDFNEAQLGSLDFAVDYTLTQVSGN